ncbi:MAG: MBL fold metallo-hydrolase [Acidobacteriota bacterium]
MKLTGWLLVGAVGVLGCAPPPTPEQQLIGEAATALGGRQRLETVRALILEGEGTQYNLGQDMRPEASGQTFTVSGWRRVIDVGGKRTRTELTRTPSFPYFQGQAPQRQTQGLDGDVAFNVAPTGSASRVAAAAARDRQAEFYHHPLTIVRAALAPETKVSLVGSEGSERIVELATSDGFAFVLAVDEAGRPTRVESRTAHPNLGDITVSTSFADYQTHGGLQLPARLTTRIDDFTTAETRIVTQTIDGDTGDLAAPAAVASASPPSPPAPNVTVEEIAKGVWLLAGQSHHSALVEFSDHLMLIEAPQSEGRTLAAIAKARELVPGKPLTKVVATHHHFDHTAGIRGAVSEGLAVITHRGNQVFFESVTKRPHTINPDALAKSRRAATVQPVDDELVLEDKTMSVVLYHVAGNPHSDTMLMAYVPRARVVIEVDAFSAGAAVNPYAANLLEQIRTRRLRVDRVVPLHGTIASLAELEKAAAAP